MDRNNETIRLAKKAADAWKQTDTYHQAAQIIDMLISALEGDPTLTPPNEPLTQADLNKMYLNEVWLECPDGSGETALVVLGKLYNTSSLEGAGLDLEEYIMGETLNNPTGNYKVYRRPPEGEDGDATRG